MPRIGGAEIQLRHLARRLSRMGHSVTIVTSTSGAASYASGESYRVIELPTIGRGLMNRLLHFTLLLPLMTYLVATHRAEVVQVNSLTSLFPSSTAAKIWRKPVVVRMWGEEQMEFLGTRINLVSSLCDSLIVLTDSARSRLEISRFPAAKIKVIPNGVVLPVSRPKQPSERPWNLLWIGQLVSLKRPDLAILAFSKVSAKRPHLRLQVVGEGPLRPRLESLSSSLGVRDKITFLGRQRHEDIAAILGNARILLITSASEGLSNVLLEGMAAGCGIVISQEASNGFIRHLQDGIVFQASEEKVAHALLELVDDVKLVNTLGAAARERVGIECSIETVARTYVELYHSLVKPFRVQ